MNDKDPAKTPEQSNFNSSNSHNYLGNDPFAIESPKEQFKTAETYDPVSLIYFIIY